MKRIAVVVFMVCMLAFAGSAMACNPGEDGCPRATWTLTDDPTNFLMSVTGTKTYTYTFDITTLGFDPTYDTVTGGTLTVWLRDDNDYAYESATISFDGTTYSDFWIGGSDTYQIHGWTSLNVDGTLTVTITATWGDFYFDKWTLSVVGTDCPTPETPDTPVPEPATMLLLGVGLAGVAYGRKRFAR